MPLRFHSGIREVWFPPCESCPKELGIPTKLMTPADCHIYGLATVVICGMWVGGLYYGLPAFELGPFCRKAAELKATDMHLVPPVALALANEHSVQSYDLSSVERVVIAAAPLKVYTATLRELIINTKQRLAGVTPAKANRTTSTSEHLPRWVARYPSIDGSPTLTRRRLRPLRMLPRGHASAV